MDSNMGGHIAIMPCLNEASNPRGIITALCTVFEGQEFHEPVLAGAAVLVLDNGSTDGARGLWSNGTANRLQVAGNIGI